MQHNLLLVGLGGTGCAVVRELKKKLYVEWRARGNRGPYPAVYTFEDSFGGQRVQSRIATLSVDSNAKDLEGEGEKDRKWRVFGETLRLVDREKVLINPTGIDRVLTSIERYPGIEPWIRGELDFVRDITRGTTEPAGCNQIRRMGRLALANGNSMENLIGGVAGRLAELSREGQTAAEIHIAFTLGCGTGSGMLLDVVVQIQKYLAQQGGAADYTLYLHGFATAKDVGSVNTGNFYANQYAALLEVNALRLGNYRPWDIQPGSEPQRLRVPSPQDEAETVHRAGSLAGTFKSLALITETTEGGKNVPLEQQIENVAEFLFQLSVRQMGDLPKPARDALSNEDRSHYPADTPGGGRSTAFIGYGVERVAIPEREIREKLAYSFARQFLLKLLYANWDNGYRELGRSFSRDGWVGERRPLWKATRDHLTLDLLEKATGDKEFETYQRDWDLALQKLEAQVKDQLGDDFGSRKMWLEDFERRAERYWQVGFRGRGVQDYFKIRRETVELQARARSLRGQIEEDLIRHLERLDPEYPLHHLPAAIGYLIERLEEDRVHFGEAEGNANRQAEGAEQARKDTKTQFDKAGRWAPGKHERLLGEYRQATVRFYYWRTAQRAAAYGQVFCGPLIDGLRELLKQLVTFDTRVKQVETFCQAEGARLIRESDQSEQQPAASADTTYLVDARFVNDTIRNRFESDKAVQDFRAGQVIEELRALRGDRFEFAAYNERMPVNHQDIVGGLWVDELRRLSEQTAIEAHRKLREDDPRFEGLLGTNIVRKLFRDYGGHVDGNLEDWLRRLIDRAMPMVAFDPNEERMDLPSDGPVLRRFVFVPKCKATEQEKDLETFQQQLHHRIEEITGSSGGCKDVKTFYQELPEERNPGEITILTVAFFFPARYTRAAHALRDKYLQRSDQKSENEARRSYFEIHTESHNPKLPDLMKLARRDVLREQLAPVLLATALDLMQVPKEAGQQILFGTVDEFGRMQSKVETGIKADPKLQELAANSEKEFGHVVSVEVVALFYRYEKEFREESLTAVQALVEERIKEISDLEAVEQRLNQVGGQSFLLGGKDEDEPTYRLFDAKSREAVELARRLAGRTLI